MEKCSICGLESIYTDSEGKNYCKGCKATYICSGCGKPFKYIDGNFVCDDCGVVI